MLQIYFLSIALNALAGYMLISAGSGGVPEHKGGFLLNNETFKFVVSILTAVTGFLKLLSVVPDEVPVVGDLFPAIAGMLAGFTLFFVHYRERSGVNVSPQTERIERFTAVNKKIIGWVAVIAAILHFIFPRVLLL